MTDHPTTNLQRRQNSRQATEHERNESLVEEGPVNLDSDEVIELQAFLERKSWIEEKITLLEQMPPIEVFAGIESLLESSGPVPGLPTREELQSWLEEHDRIDAETEQFDTGDMNRLKKFAKAKSKQNLSPEDTDLIELTLTTLLALDKLIHLLRVRSDNLELMNLRLSWEEGRLLAWKDRDSLLNDLEAFIKARARWSPSAYETLASNLSLPLPPTSPSHTPARASKTHASPTPAAFSRSTRYKISELLTREAAGFGSRISHFKKDTVGAPGRTVDKIIDTSRQPVPDAMLDEQEKLENGCNVMDGLGKFAMNVMVQWKKADELYGELKKDQGTAASLLTEIEAALKAHPNQRQGESFAARSASLASRVKLLGDLSKLVPRPVHALYPDQTSSNLSILTTLGSEHALALKQAQDVANKAKEYSKAVSALKDLEKCRDTLKGLASKLRSVSSQLLQGTQSRDGDGSPLDLTSEDCLDPLRHGAYLALLPALVADIDKADNDAQHSLILCRTRLLELDQGTLDPSFKQETQAVIDAVEIERRKAKIIKDDVTASAQRLRDIRKIWISICDAASALDDTRQEINESIETQRWKPQRAQGGGPLTPDSPSPTLPAPSISSTSIIQRLDDLNAQLASSTFEPLSSILLSLQPRVSGCLQANADDLLLRFKALRTMTKLWDEIVKQSAVMTQVMTETQDLESQVDNLRSSLEDARHLALKDVGSEESMGTREEKMKAEVDAVRANVKSFTDGLWQRIPFVASQPTSLRGVRSNSTMRVTRVPSFSAQTSNISKLGPSDAISVNLASLDASVRGDANAVSMSLTSGADMLSKKLEHLSLIRLARVVDTRTHAVISEVASISNATAEKRAIFEAIRNPEDTSVELSDKLSAMGVDVEEFAKSARTRMDEVAAGMRDAFQHFQTAPTPQDVIMQENLVSSPKKSVDDAEARLATVLQAITTLKESISEEDKAVSDRRRLAQEESLRLEALNQAQREEEEKARLESEERERQAAAERAILEEKERARLEHEAIERQLAEERARTDAEANYRAQMEKRAQEELLRSQSEELTRLRAAEQARLVEDRKRSASESSEQACDEFPLKESSNGSLPPDMVALRLQIISLRDQLTSLEVQAHARPAPPTDDMSSVPDILSVDEVSSIKSQFENIAQAFAALPTQVDVSSIHAEIKSLRFDIEATRPLLERLDALAAFSASVGKCDLALSDLLEHIDSYPALPITESVSDHTPDPALPPEEQLSARVAFCREAIEDMTHKTGGVGDDPRVNVERERVEQTWVELLDMSTDKIGRIRSRAPSSASSFSSHDGGRMPLSRATSHMRNPHTPRSRTMSQTSTTPLRRGPSVLRPEMSSRSSSRFSTRSVSGPILSSILSPSPSLYSSTYASRQRTTSTSSMTSSLATPTRRPESPYSRQQLRPQTFGKRRAPSPATSDASGPSFATTIKPPSWQTKQPRRSFGTTSRNFKPLEKEAPKERRSYVPNPKNKLDVAVGDIVNKLPVNINIEAVPSVTWQDQSGKYWIGDTDPKLCFCRILRSRTVMVRVGGGWVELSKFIKDHYADLFRRLPSASPPRVSIGTREERWISSSTVLETPEALLESPLPLDDNSPPRAPRTPEPKTPYRASLSPNISVTAPSNGTSPGSIRSSSPSSPLVPLQFMRRADDTEISRPVSPLAPRTSIGRGKETAPRSRNVSKTLIWRF